MSTHDPACDPNDPELPCATFVCIVCGEVTQDCRVHGDFPTEDRCIDCAETEHTA
jgi:hypothetical protein